MTPIQAILDHLADMCPIKGEITTRKLEGDTMVALPNGRFRRIRCQRSMNRAYARTKGLPIEHPQVLDGTPLEWEAAE
jgi:hypothetical protein